MRLLPESKEPICSRVLMLEQSLLFLYSKRRFLLSEAVWARDRLG